MRSTEPERRPASAHAERQDAGAVAGQGGPTHTWRAPELGDARTVDVPQGRLEYFDRGRGPTVVLAHGWLANANLWRHVVTALADAHRCVVLDLPFGSHRRAMRAGADLTPEGCGRMIADAIDALGVDDVTLIGNDSGGAYSQIATAGRPARIRRLVLNSCETLYDSFPPPPFDALPQIAASAEMLRSVLAPLEDRAARLGPQGYALVAKRPIDDRVSDSYALPCLRDDDVLRDTASVMRSAATPPLHDAARRLIAEYERPVLFVWSPEDRLFPPAHPERYAAELTDARVVLVDDAYSFTPEDQPRRLADAIAAFVGDTRA